MARKEDLLFCKIAIAHGVVTQAQAQKVLAHVEKREREDGKRPRIGTVFAKANLIEGDQVRTIYEAISKRTGRPAGGRPAAGGRQRAASARAGGRSRRGREPTRARAPRREIDPQTLWTGVGFGVVFLVVIGIIMFLFIRSGAKPDPSLAESAAPSSAASLTAPVLSTGSGNGSAAPTASPKPPTGGQVLSQDQKHQFQQMIGDARRDLSEDPGRGLKLIARIKEDLAFLTKRGYETSAYTADATELERELTSEVAKLDAAGKEDEGVVLNEDDPPAATVSGDPEPAGDDTVDSPTEETATGKAGNDKEPPSLDDFFDE